MGHMVTVANELAKREGISRKGYRLVVKAAMGGRRCLTSTSIF